MGSVADRLQKTARAYQVAVEQESAAKQALEEAKKTRAQAALKVAAARGPLAEAIADAARAGVRQRDILVALGGTYSRERVRQICRAAGVEPAE
jgi:aspartokinase